MGIGSAVLGPLPFAITTGAIVEIFVALRVTLVSMISTVVSASALAAAQNASDAKG